MGPKMSMSFFVFSQRAAMGPGGGTIRLVSVEAEEELTRTFQCPVLLKVRLKLQVSN